METHIRSVMLLHWTERERDNTELPSWCYWHRVWVRRNVMQYKLQAVADVLHLVVTRLRAKFCRRTTRRLGGDGPQTK